MVRTEPFQSETRIINTDAGPARLFITTLGPTPQSRLCRFTTGIIPAGGADRLRVDPSVNAWDCADKVFTIVIDSSQPLIVRSAVESSPVPAACRTQNYQEVPAARTWLPANQNVRVPEFDRDNALARANLFLTNPNLLLPISVDLTFSREATVIADRIEVPPATTRTLPVPYIRGGCDEMPCESAYSAVRRANGEFMAGISSAYDSGGEWYFPAVPAVDPPPVPAPFTTVFKGMTGRTWQLRAVVRNADQLNDVWSHLSFDSMPTQLNVDFAKYDLIFSAKGVAICDETTIASITEKSGLREVAITYTTRLCTISVAANPVHVVAVPHAEVSYSFVIFNQ